ncbi:MAG: PDZ domain-containing protein [Myxococcota bacterium]|nr:PDZ domain-containing protein [Myxococcota bacterium]
MIKPLAAGAIAIALGAFAFVTWGSRREPPAAAPAASASESAAALAAVEARLVSLEQRLELEAASRGELAQALERLEARLLAAAPATASPVRPTARTDALASGPPAAESEPAPPRSPRRGFGFEPEPLLAAGFAPREVERYAARLDELELQRLYLRDQATREGWIDTPRYARERRQLFGDLRSLRGEFGDELYDWSLYTTGHPNRAQVNDVMEGSAAQQAGIEPGDVVQRYADVVVLSADELRDLTTAGEPGEVTPVDLLRDGEERRVYLPRGPMGVRLDMVSIEPPARR